MMMLGGSPTRVAVPPMLDANTSASRNGIAGSFSRSHTSRVTPVHGRPRPDAERTVGYFVQSVLLRVDASGGPGFAELVDQLRTVYSEALDRSCTRSPSSVRPSRSPPGSATRHGPHPHNCPAWPAGPGSCPAAAPCPGRCRAATGRGVPELTVVGQPDDGLRRWLQYNALAFDLPVISELAWEFTAALTAACGCPPARRRFGLMDWRSPYGPRRTRWNGAGPAS